MDYKEYAFEDKAPVNLEMLKASHIPTEDYRKAHQNTILLCADVMIWYKDGFLLVKRDNVPAKEELWPIGGRMQRGVLMDENVRNKVRAECGLTLKDLTLINVGRTIFRTAPFDHGNGTDTVSFMYFARGSGNIRLDEFHSRPIIVDWNKFNEIRSSLHPYVVDFMELAFKCIKKN